MRITSPACGAAAVLTVLLLGPCPARGQETLFNPSISLEYGYTDNVEFSGTDQTSDNATRLAVMLPVVRYSPKGWIVFSYSPSYYKYRDSDLLDRDEHRLRFGVSRQTSRRSWVDFTTRFARTQTQGDVLNQGAIDLPAPGAGAGGDLPPLDLEEGSLLLTERTERDLIGADLGLRHQPSERWTWSARVGASDWQHTRIEGFPEGPESAVVEDRTEYRASTGGARSLSRTTSLGVRYGYRHTKLDISGEEDMHSVVLTLEHQAGPHLSFGGEIGGYTRTSTPPEDGAGDLTRNGMRAMARLRRSYRRVVFGMFAGYAPTSGGDLAGTSTDSTLGLSLAGAGSVAWDWNIGARYTRREPTDPDQPTRYAAGAYASVERRFGRSAALRLTASQVQQDNGVDGVEDPSVFRALFGVVWYPVGHTRLAGGQSL